MAYGERFRAYAVFQFAEVRKVQTAGLLRPSAENDILRGIPVGVQSRCVLEETSDVFMMNPKLDKVTLWRRFSIRTSTFSLDLEAGTVHIFCGRQAQSQYGWANTV